MAKQKVALVTGVTGQDGAYLSELLLNTQYKVYGLVRRSSTPNRDNISHFIDHGNFVPFYGDLSDTNSLLSMLRDTKPDEIYNLGAQSDVGISFNIPVSTGDINALGTMRIIDCVRTLNLDLDTKIYQASTSELFGKVHETPQTETTPFYPRSPYGVSKLYAYWAVKKLPGILRDVRMQRYPVLTMRVRYGVRNFVTRKITKAVAEMYARDRKDPIELGNMEAKRDWGHAKDYVKGMWQMMQEQESRRLHSCYRRNTFNP